MSRRVQLEMLPQPDDWSCGPTCLHSIYRYHGDDVSLDEVIAEVRTVPAGGTLAVFMGCHALRRGYKARIYTFNLQIFDPTWFAGKNARLAERLRRQAEAKAEPKLRLATQGYLEFLERGGEVLFQDLSANLIKRYLNRSLPILTGLSATYLYKSQREYGPEADEDDIRGEPAGHFVVLCEYVRKRRKVLVADPYRLNPFSNEHYYHVGLNRLIHSVLLGIVTYDANVLVIEPAAP